MKAAWSKIVVGNLDCRILPVVDHGGVLSDPAALKLVASSIDELLRPRANSIVDASPR